MDLLPEHEQSTLIETAPIITLLFSSNRKISCLLLLKTQLFTALRCSTSTQIWCRRWTCVWKRRVYRAALRTPRPLGLRRQRSTLSPSSPSDKHKRSATSHRAGERRDRTFDQHRGPAGPRPNAGGVTSQIAALVDRERSREHGRSTAGTTSTAGARQEHGRYRGARHRAALSDIPAHKRCDEELGTTKISGRRLAEEDKENRRLIEVDGRRQETDRRRRRETGD